MLVEIHGTNFRNKGSELMMRATVAELRQRIAGIQFAIDPTIGEYEQRCEIGLRQIVPFRRWMSLPGFVRRLRLQQLASRLGPLKRLGRYYGCVTLDQVDALVDAAGFAYSDEWGARPVKNFSALTKVYKNAQKPIVMLPQAFGPFAQEGTKRSMSEVVENSSILYARDRVSYGYVSQFADDSEKVRRAPDLTLFYPEPNSMPRPAEESSYCCIVPNYRMLDQGKREWGDRYVSLLARTVTEVAARSIETVIVLHDLSGADESIAQSVLQKVDAVGPSVVKEKDPVALKKLAAGSLMVIGSRYHALLAAFSGTVPSICFGWSHKYETLYEEFGCKDLVFDPTATWGSILSKVAELCDVRLNNLYRRRIGVHLSRMRRAHEAMWTTVTEHLTSHRGKSRK
jgi:colanic acid/amylovoran biosynthesis protein